VDVNLDTQSTLFRVRMCGKSTIFIHDLISKSVYDMIERAHVSSLSQDMHAVVLPQTPEFPRRSHNSIV
jgi:hypothetical protein